MATFPSTATFNASTIRDNQNIYQTQFNDKSIRQRAGVGQSFEFSLASPPMTRAQFWPITAFLNANRGNAFYINHPQYGSPLGSPGGTPLVNGASQTGTSLITDGWTPSTNGLLKAGDVFTIAGDDKVYMCAADVDSDGSGNATITLTSPLVSSPLDNDALTTTGVQFSVVLKNSVQEYSADIDGHYKYVLNLIEAF